MYTGLLSTTVQLFLQSSRQCSYIATLQQDEKVRKEEEAKRLEAVRQQSDVNCV